MFIELEYYQELLQRLYLLCVEEGVNLDDSLLTEIESLLIRDGVLEEEGGR